MSDEEPISENPMREAFEFAAENTADLDITEQPTLGADEWKPPELAAIDALLPGYEVKRTLGQGGMGAVYEALQTSLDRRVAIKILSAELVEADPSFEARFQREAKAMAQLDHPNIVTVYDFGKTSEGHCYFVMEYVDGTDFHRLIHSGGLDTKSALEAIGQICDALEYAHDKGFVHRDIKPANIFINREHRIKVGDFGLAKIVKGENEEELMASSLVTQTGAIMGTPWYSAPEQLKGEEVDHRADIYSLGVMFYEMLTGEVPRGAVSPPSRRVQLDIRLDEVVLRAMADRPEARYQTVAEVRTDVDEIRTTPSVRPQKKTEQKRSPVAIVAILTALVSAGAGGYFWITSPHHELKAELEEKFPTTTE